MNLKFATTLAFAIIPPIAIAEDISKPWTSVTFNVMHADSAAAVTLNGDDSLSKVNLSVIGASIEVPEAELAGIDQPRLDTAQLLFGEDWYGEWKEGEEPTPHFIIEMNFGQKSDFGNLPTVRFLFHSGEYQQRIVSTQKTETVWQEFRKLPNEEPVATGTATRPPHRPEVMQGSPEKGE